MPRGVVTELGLFGVRRRCKGGLRRPDRCLSGKYVGGRLSVCRCRIWNFFAGWCGLLGRTETGDFLRTR